VKKILFAVMLVAVFSLVAMAQDARTPGLVLSHGGDASVHNGFGWGPSPAACTGCLFYGGDVNPNDPNVQGFANGNTLLVPTTTTYGAVKVPATGHYVGTGLFFNQEPTQSGGTLFDPATGTYDVRTGVASGVGGSSVAHGSNTQTATATGRLPFGLTEYTTSVNFTSPLTAQDGKTFWLNESPQCTNSANSLCGVMQYFFSNTTQKTGSVNGSAQPSGMLFFNSAFFGFTWTNWCDPSLGQNAQQCADGSFGVLGHT